MEGFEVNTIESTLGTADIHVTTAGTCDSIIVLHSLTHIGLPLRRAPGFRGVASDGREG